ncbi:O-antigen ligase family protein [uncultured Vibrio sp.]|uniref:O-antigen ligase family protein n=1 Tax=uncultured Vibrio sp. TaxID=114054 RepID=UPI0025E6FEA8|nr:O-antigen ligase family protein [uncultured Vibrio sp.]
MSNGQTYLAYFLVTASIYNIATKQGFRCSFRNKYLVFPLLAYAIVLALNYLYTKEFWVVIRSTLYFIPFALTTPIHRGSVKKLALSLPLFSITIAFLYMYTSYSLGSERGLESSGLNPIPLATVMLFQLSIMISSLIYFKYSKSSKLFIIVGMIFLFFSIIQTETRSAWLCLLVISITFSLVYIYKPNINYSTKRIFCTLLMFILIFFLFTSDSFTNRVNKTKQEIELITSGNYKTSIGIRFELWEHSLGIIKENWYIFPAQEHEIETYFKNKVKEGKANKGTLKHIGNSHNQYINAWLRSGLLGLVATLGIIIIPVYEVTKKYGYKNGILTISIGSVVFVSGLTEVPLIQIAAYQAFLMSMLISFIIVDKRT